MTIDPDPTCSACDLPYRLLAGCTSPDAERFHPWEDTNNQPCPDCAAHPDNLHHVGCSFAYCLVTGLQGLMCEHCDEVHDRLMGKEQERSG